jgi:hypothetical protein
MCSPGHQLCRHRRAVLAKVSTYRHGSRPATDKQRHIDDMMKNADCVAAWRDIEGSVFAGSQSGYWTLVNQDEVERIGAAKLLFSQYGDSSGRASDRERIDQGNFPRTDRTTYKELQCRH